MKRLQAPLFLLACILWAGPLQAALRLDSVDRPANSPLEEGSAVLLRFQGEGLTSDLVPEFVVNGAALGAFSQFVAQGTNAGVRFHIPVLTNLAAFVALPGELRLHASDGSSVTWPLTLVGRDELMVRSGETLRIDEPSRRKFSTVLIESNATVRVGGTGQIDWESTGPVTIDGVVDASGANGASAAGGTFGGPAGRNSGRGGTGGDLAGPAPRVPTAGGDGSHPFPAHREAVSGGFSYFEPAGLGGLPGHNEGAATNIPCLRFERFLGDQPPFDCTDAIVQLLEYGRLPERDHSFSRLLLAGAQGWSGVGVDATQPRPRAGHGGGGGGGGGAEVLFGGGGGAGGEGGWGVRILSGSTFTLNGFIRTDGGRGGDGWRADSLTTPLPELPTLGDLTLSGGGGGGGAPGELILASRSVFSRPPATRVFSARGGEPGHGGVQLYDASDIRGEPWVERSVLRVTPGRHGPRLGFQQGPVFDPAAWEDTVTAASILELSDAGAQAGIPQTFEIRGEDPGQVRVVTLAGVTNGLLVTGPFRAMLPLFPGFNTLIARPTDGEEPLDDPTYHVLFRRVLSLNGLATCDANCEALLANPYAENGTVRYMVGDGVPRPVFVVDNVPATHTGVRTDMAMRMAHGPDGSLYFLQTHRTGAGLPPGIVPQAIRRVDPHGIITTVAGAGTNTADNIPASESLLRQQPLALSVAPDGRLCLLEQASPGTLVRVRQIGTDGILSTFVGGGVVSELVAGVSVPATSVNLNPSGSGLAYSGLGHDAAGNLYVSHRIWRTYTSPGNPGTIASNFVGVISRITPGGQLTPVIGGAVIALGGLRSYEWDDAKALAAATQPQALAVAPDGRIYFYDSTGVIVKADPDDDGDYVLRNLTGLPTTPGLRDDVADGVPAREVTFAGTQSLALAPDGCLYTAGTTLTPPVSAPTIRKITPGGVCLLVMGAGENWTPTNGQPAKLRGTFSYTSDISVGPDNRVVFVAQLGASTQLAKVVQPFDAPLPYPTAPVVAFETHTLAVWETNGTVLIPLRRSGYAGPLHIVVDRIGSNLDVGASLVRGNFAEDDTRLDIPFLLANRAGVQGTRTVEFSLRLESPNAWVAPLTEPALEEALGQPSRLTLYILDDESPFVPPQLLVPLRNPGDPLLPWQAIGIPGRLYSLQTTVDFSAWDNVETNSSPTGLLQFHPNPNLQRQFFRLLELQP